MVLRILVYLFVITQSVTFTSVTVMDRSVSISWIAGVPLLFVYVLYSFGRVNRRVISPVLPTEVKLLLAFLLTSIVIEVARYASGGMDASLRAETIQFIATLGQILVMYYVLFDLMHDRGLLIGVIVSSLATSIFLLIYTYAAGQGVLAESGRLSTQGVDANWVGSVSTSLLTLAMLKLAHDSFRVSISNIVIAIAAGFLLVFLLLTGSRGALVALVAGTISVFALNRSPRRAVYYLAIISVAIYFGSRETQKKEYLVTGRLGHAVTEYRSEQRLGLVLHGIEMFKKSPLVGYGVGYMRTIGEPFGVVSMVAHNVLVQTLVQSGVVAAAILVIAFIVMFIRLLRSRKDFLTKYVFTLFVLLLVGSLFGNAYAKGYFITLAIINSVGVKGRE